MIQLNGSESQPRPLGGCRARPRVHRERDQRDLGVAFADCLSRVCVCVDHMRRAVTNMIYSLAEGAAALVLVPVLSVDQVKRQRHAAADF